MLTVFEVEREPEPVTLMARKPVLPVILIVVPPLPEPLPRRTTPLALIFNWPLMWKVPAARSTAPRKPLASRGSAETALIADWMAEVSSPPDGLTVRCVATTGKGTPPAL